MDVNTVIEESSPQPAPMEPSQPSASWRGYGLMILACCIVLSITVSMSEDMEGLAAGRDVEAARAFVEAIRLGIEAPEDDPESNGYARAYEILSPLRRESMSPSSFLMYFDDLLATHRVLLSVDPVPVLAGNFMVRRATHILRYAGSEGRPVAVALEVLVKRHGDDYYVDSFDAEVIEGER